MRELNWIRPYTKHQWIVWIHLQFMVFSYIIVSPLSEIGLGNVLFAVIGFLLVNYSLLRRFHFKNEGAYQIIDLIPFLLKIKYYYTYKEMYAIKLNYSGYEIQLATLVVHFSEKSANQSKGLLRQAIYKKNEDFDDLFCLLNERDVMILNGQGRIINGQKDTLLK